MKQGANILVVDHIGRVLLQQRNHDRPISAPGAWSMWGGKMEAGESPREAAVRELFEEIGVSVNPDDLIPLTVFTRPTKVHGEVEEHVFRYDLPMGTEIVFGEGEGYGYFRVEEIPHLYMDTDGFVATQILSYLAA